MHASIINATATVRAVLHEPNVVGEKHLRAKAVAVQDAASALVDPLAPVSVPEMHTKYTQTRTHHSHQAQAGQASTPQPRKQASKHRVSSSRGLSMG
mmetsp:Transcript_36467/g.70333  ORF Transcript_36467/g.70333 Transcript_36467/m.70333 type:complete len:97 (-) Transcript_36467:463-753(-)